MACGTIVEFTFKVVNTGNTIMDFTITDDVNPSFVGTFFNILPGGFGSISFGVPVDSTIIGTGIATVQSGVVYGTATASVKVTVIT